MGKKSNIFFFSEGRLGGREDLRIWSGWGSLIAVINVPTPPRRWDWIELLFCEKSRSYWLPTLVQPPFLFLTFQPPPGTHTSKQALHTLEECPLGIPLVSQHCSTLSSHQRRNFENWQLFHKIKWRGGNPIYLGAGILASAPEQSVPSEKKE